MKYMNNEYMIDSLTIAFIFRKISNRFEGKISVMESVSYRMEKLLYQKGVFIIDNR